MLTAHCLDFLSDRKGQILNISSSHGITPYAETSAYGSTKAALNFLTKIWSLELASLGIRVNAIAPGPTESDILNGAGFTDDIIAVIHDSERKAIPLQRRGSVADIVSIATAILDSKTSWITGVILPVDGGLSGS
jgi:NAD(P)-dependent dehydrogenase (short-subunit alcohol dehydrogenase family)